MEERFVVRAIRDAEDARGFIELNAAVTCEGEIADRLIHHRPGADPSCFLVAEEAESRKIVSTTCLLPWELDYQGVRIRTAMLEMVVTHPDYRRHGLVRSQIERYHHLVDELAFDLCIIQGIPNYYRQYGYAYALDHNPCILILPASVPRRWRPGRMEPAGAEQYPRLAALRAETALGLGLHVTRDEPMWQYLGGHVGFRYTLLYRHGAREPGGYAATRIADGKVHVDEQAFLDLPSARAFLAWAARQAPGGIRIQGHRYDALWRAAVGLGGTAVRCDQWLLRLPDPLRFLRKIGPALEARLGRSGLPADSALVINLYRRALRLRFEDGRLGAVEDMGFVDTSLGSTGRGDLRIPPDAFVRLAMGYRGLDELVDAWPETEVEPSARALVEALFPRMESFVHMPY